MSADNSAGSELQVVVQTSGSDVDDNIGHDSRNSDNSIENIDTGSEFDDLYSHEEDNGGDDDGELESEESGDDGNTDDQTVETGQEEDLNVQHGSSGEESDNSSEPNDEDQESHSEENDDIKEEKEEEEEEEGEGEGSDSSSSSNSDSTSESEEENEDGSEEEGDDENGGEENNNKEDLKNVDFNLLEKQIKYLVDSDMLNSDDFKALSREGKITAIVNLINSNPETALPGYTQNSEVLQNHTTTSSLSNKRTLDYSNDGESSSNLPTQGKPASKYERPNLSMPMTLKERDLYAAYLRGENKITEMHNIPAKSRLFIGNLPLKNVTKEDLFRIFIPYGHILQINIKNAFGFIQYDNPTSVLEAIKYESDEINFGKKLILEVSSSNSRPQFDHGDHGTNSSSTFISSSKRPFQTDGTDDADMYNDGSGYKKPKRRIPNCVIYVKRTADRTFATEVFNSIKNGTGIETDMIFLKPRMELRKLINDAAYDGSWGVIIVNKSRNVDIQIFYKGPSGETKFDEYVNVSCPDAVSIFNNVKNQRRGTMGVGMIPGGGNMYGGYNQPPMGPGPNAGYGYGTRYGSIPPQQMPPPAQGYMGYQAPGAGGYQASPPLPQQQPAFGGMNQGNYSRYQSQPAPPPQQGSMTMNQPYGKYPPPAPTTNQTPAQQQTMLPQSPQQNNVQPQLSAALSGNATQMNQQQLLAAIQNLPPNVVSSLLSAAQQQQQPPNQQQQQLLGMLQNTQNQQSTQPQNTYPPMGNNTSYDSSKMQGQSQPTQQQQQQTQQPGSNVQSLLDSLAKLQK